MTKSVDRQRISLVKLKPHQCKWPVHENRKVVGRFLFCGCPQIAGSNYCEEHHAAAYTTPYRSIAGIVGPRIR